MILGLGVTERMWRSSFGRKSESGEVMACLGPSSRCNALQRDDATGSAHVANLRGLEINLFLLQNLQRTKIGEDTIRVQKLAN